MHCMLTLSKTYAVETGTAPQLSLDNFNCKFTEFSRGVGCNVNDPNQFLMIYMCLFLLL
jgi:hypothetical protein